MGLQYTKKVIQATLIQGHPKFGRTEEFSGHLFPFLVSVFQYLKRCHGGTGMISSV